MDWLKNRTIRRYAAIGVMGGILLLFAGLWLELSRENLPLTWQTVLYIHRIQPIVILTDLAPLVIGTMAGLLGSQVHLSATVISAKKELETVFDAISDLIVVTTSTSRTLSSDATLISYWCTRPASTFLARSRMGSPMN